MKMCQKRGNEIRHGSKATCLSLMRLCKEQIVSEVQRSQLHYVVKSFFLSYNQHDRNQSNTAIIGRIELVAGMFIRQRLSSFHKFILSSWCIIVYHIISAQRVGFFNIGSGRVLGKIPGSGSGSGRVGVLKYTIGYFWVPFLISGISGYFGYFRVCRVFLGLPIYTRVIL